MVTVALAHEAETSVDLELVLIADVSTSMRADEQLLQRQGYVDAFRNPDVIRAINAGGGGRIATTYVEWAGTYHQRVLVPWTLIESQADAQAFSAALEALPMAQMDGGTSISSALLFAAALFTGNEFSSQRRVIDISGDGPNNGGAPVHLVRDVLVAQGIVINGLPIMVEGSLPSGWPGFPTLDTYYADCVIGGPGAFSLPVKEKGELALAVRRKLILEIAAEWPQLIPVRLERSAPRIDCRLAEKMWRELGEGP